MEKIFEAYAKLKSYVYYNNSLIYLKTHIANFEINLEKNIQRLINAIESKDYSFFNNLIKKVRCHIIPKETKFESDNIDFITNNVNNDKWSIIKQNHFIIAPVELWIINVFWCITTLFKLSNIDEKHLYGNILELNKTAEIKKGKKLFKPYFTNYSKWIKNGIKKAEYLASENMSFVILSLDIKRYFYNVRIQQSKLNNDLKSDSKVNEVESFVHEINLKLHNDYSTRHFSIPSDIGFHLPIGLPSSSILANWYLRKLDKKILMHLKPEYYGRYVDDIFIVKQVNKNQQYKNSTEIIQNLLIQNKILIKENEDGEDKLKIRGYDKYLSINKDKLKCFVFHGKDNTGVFKKIEDEIKKTSSAVSLLPEENTILEMISDIPVNLSRNLKISKINEIEFIKNDTHAISILLSKVLYILKFNILEKKTIDKLVSTIQKYFYIKNLIQLRKIIPKYITFLVALEKERELNNLILRYSELLYYKNDPTVNGDDINSSILDELLNNLYLAFSGNFIFAKKFIAKYKKIKYKKAQYKYSTDVYSKLNFKMIKQFRKSFLQNDQYFKNTEIIFNRNFVKIDKNLYTSQIINQIPFILDDSFNNYLKLPRLIKRHEAYMIAVYLKLQQKKLGINFENYQLIKTAANIYWNVNFKHFFNVDFKKVINKEYIDIDEPIANDKYKIEHTIPRKSQNDSFERLRVAITNLEVSKQNIDSMLNGSKYNNIKKYISISRLLNDAKLNKVDMIIFPELSIPIEWLSALSTFAYKNRISISGGLEYIQYNSQIINCIFTILPYKTSVFTGADLVIRPKNHYSPHEIKMFNELSLTKPDYMPLYHLFKWNNTVFTIFNCFELASIEDRNYFKGKIDLLIGISWNKDRFYYESIAISTVRDLHCYLTNVNTAQFKGSYILQPTSSDFMYIAEIKGGKNITYVAEDINIKALREFQRSYTPINNSEQFKPLPPGYVMDPDRL